MLPDRSRMIITLVSLAVSTDTSTGAAVGLSSSLCVPSARRSRLEIDRRLVTAVHVERHREVLVRSLPSAVRLGEPNGGTQ
jgi:hypothetical protein